VTGPLSGVKIVELAQMIAVPGATHLLANQGAEIIKVENTTGGDDLRMYGSRKGNMSGWFANANAGKRSIGLNLEEEEAKEILRTFIKDADVFIEGFRPGAVSRLGFSADEAFKINPRLVYVSSSGFGAEGPYSDRPVYDPVIQAISGWAGAQRTADGPTLIRGMVADKVAALTTSQAITAALFARNETGEYQHVQVSMLEANIAFNWPDVMMHETVLDDDALHLPNLLGSYQLFSTSDGWLSVTAGTDSQWKAVCSALSREDLAKDERFTTASNRSKHFTEWYASFDEMLGAFTTEEALQKCQAADVPAVSVLDPSEVAHDIHVKEVEAVAEIEHPIVGKMRVPRQGAIFNNTTEHKPRHAPAYCQDTIELLTEIGYSTDAIEKLKLSGTIS
tara:strand:- start:2529 stop:3707 length:1179 start_codon:yes stop_codon:yes gene_type:complete